MPSISVVRTLIREIFTLQRSERVNEPDLVMDDPEKVIAYTQAGREDGVMAAIYLFNCAQISEVVRPGDVAVDLGCGPATQLAMVARLNPQTQFIGVDLSDEMLLRARAHIDEQGLDNVEFHQANISHMQVIASDSADVVFSTLALHHLPDFETLDATFAEVSRILKPSGGLYLIDFGRLKAEKSIDYFAHQYADRQPELFTLDYLYSLRAAFTRRDFREVAARHLPDANLTSTFLMPFLVAIKNQSRSRVPETSTVQQLREISESLPAHHATDLKDMVSLFRAGGLPSRIL